LGPLEEYDRRRHLGLIDTLEAYLEADGQISLAAKSLNIHRNSMIYRVKRLQEISGYNLSSYADLFQLQLALALRKLSQA
jgi:purine catabolism regulator